MRKRLLQRRLWRRAIAEALILSHKSDAFPCQLKAELEVLDTTCLFQVALRRISKGTGQREGYSYP
jgi:hypothetical protein